MPFFRWPRYLRSLLFHSPKNTYRKKRGRFAPLHVETKAKPCWRRCVISSVTPANGSTISIVNPLSAPPALVVTFNEDMNNAGGGFLPTDVSNPANYLLFTATGQPVTVNSATYNNNGGAGPFQVTLTYNNNAPLSAGTYTLLVQGGELQEAAVPNLPMSQAGQLVVANESGSSVSVVGVNTAGDSGLEAATNFPVNGYFPPRADGSRRRVAWLQRHAGSERPGHRIGRPERFGGQHLRGPAGGGLWARSRRNLEPARRRRSARSRRRPNSKTRPRTVRTLRSASTRPWRIRAAKWTFSWSTSPTALNYLPAAVYPAATAMSAPHPIGIISMDVDGNGVKDLAVAESLPDTMGLYCMVVFYGAGGGVWRSPPPSARGLPAP